MWNEIKYFLFVLLGGEGVSRNPSMRKLLLVGTCIGVGDWAENKFARLLLTKLACDCAAGTIGTTGCAGPPKSSPPRRSSKSKLEEAAAGEELGLLFVTGIESNVSNPPSKFSNEFLTKIKINLVDLKWIINLIWNLPSLSELVQMNVRYQNHPWAYHHHLHRRY